LQLKDARVLRKLPMNVEITLTRAKRQEQREGALAAIPVITGFDTLLPETQMRSRPAHVQAVQGMGFDNADQFFKSKEEIAQAVMQQLGLEGYTLVPPAVPPAGPGVPGAAPGAEGAPGQPQEQPAPQEQPQVA
jgi:hypothetical protein